MEDIRVEGRFWPVIYFTAIWHKAGNELLKTENFKYPNYEYPNFETLRKTLDLYFHLSSPPLADVCVCERLKEGNIAVFAQKNRGD